MRTDQFDYFLPPELIAQHPLAARDDSKLLVLQRPTSPHLHTFFHQIDRFLTPQDLLILNDSKVIPARLRGTRPSGGNFEILLLEEINPNDWWVMLKPGRRTPIGMDLTFHTPTSQPTSITARVLEKNQEGHCRLIFGGTTNVINELHTLGEIPLPPYIARGQAETNDPSDLERYQTVYATPPGSVAAPTAGLHFTKDLLAKFRTATVTLHVGLGTFAPVKADEVSGHIMHEERYEVPPTTADAIRETRRQGGRVVAVGTTSLRVLESVAARHDGGIVAGSGRTSIFIHPPYKFRCVDALVTNFHLPRSTLLMLVSAFAEPGGAGGIQKVREAYEEAVRQSYRFFSYGDAMLIL